MAAPSLSSLKSLLQLSAPGRLLNVQFVALQPHQSLLLVIGLVPRIRQVDPQVLQFVFLRRRQRRHHRGDRFKEHLHILPS